MEVLKATSEQKELLEGNYNNGHVLRFVKDADDNWIVGIRVIEDPNFAQIKDQLEQLERIEYKPKKINI